MKKHKNNVDVDISGIFSKEQTIDYKRVKRRLTLSIIVAWIVMIIAANLAIKGGWIDGIINPNEEGQVFLTLMIFALMLSPVASVVTACVTRGWEQYKLLKKVGLSTKLQKAVLIATTVGLGIICAPVVVGAIAFIVANIVSMVSMALH